MLFRDLFAQWAHMIHKDHTKLEVELDTYAIHVKGDGTKYEEYSLKVYVDIPKDNATD